MPARTRIAAALCWLACIAACGWVTPLQAQTSPLRLIMGNRQSEVHGDVRSTTTAFFSNRMPKSDRPAATFVDRYDDRHRVVEETMNVGNDNVVTTAFTYDANGMIRAARATSRTRIDTTVIDIVPRFDAAGRIESLIGVRGGMRDTTTIWRFTYDAAGRLLHARFEDKGTRHVNDFTYTYDPAGSVAEWRRAPIAKGSGDSCGGHLTIYDAAGVKLAERDTACRGGALVISFSEYRAGRVVRVTKNQDGTESVGRYEYDDDRRGNWIRRRAYDASESGQPGETVERTIVYR